MKIELIEHGDGRAGKFVIYVDEMPESVFSFNENEQTNKYRKMLYGRDSNLKQAELFFKELASLKKAFKSTDRILQSIEI